MMRQDELVAAITGLRADDLAAWIRDALVTPRVEASTQVFSEMQCARVRLLCTLRYDLEVEAETLPLVVSLVDELYDTRRRLLAMAAAVTAQDERTRAAILRAIERADGSPGSAAAADDKAG